LRELRGLDKKIIVTVSLIIWVFALGLVNPAISKKPDNKVEDFSNNGVDNGDISIEVYWDNRCTKRVSSIDWGPLEPGTNKTVTLFIKNKGRNQITLVYYTSNWKPPEIVNYLTLTWNYTGQSIEFKKIVPVVFTLYVSENAEAIESFSFDTPIIGTQ
jgi:hypothetical protein